MEIISISLSKPKLKKIPKQKNYSDNTTSIPILCVNQARPRVVNEDQKLNTPLAFFFFFFVFYFIKRSKKYRHILK